MTRPRFKTGDRVVAIHGTIQGTVVDPRPVFTAGRGSEVTGMVPLDGCIKVIWDNKPLIEYAERQELLRLVLPGKPGKPSDKDLMVADARERFSRLYPDVYAAGACLWWANTIIEVAADHGMKLCIQAGTLMWPRVPDELDDGVSPTHFSYVWEGLTRRNELAVRCGQMPEMHVWAGCVETQSIIDLTVGYLPRQCKKLTGLDWLTPEPDGYLWLPSSQVPPSIVYGPDPDATILAGIMWDRQRRSKPPGARK